MTYIEYLNQFHRWRENGNPGDKLIVLYLNMLDMFNQRYWPEWAGVTTEELMVLAHTNNKKTAFTARDGLVRAGFLQYRPGRKGKATAYKLLSLSGESATENDTENGTGNGNGYKSATENDTENDTKSDTKNSTPIKTKTPTKTKDFLSSSFSKTKTTTGAAATDWSSSASSDSDREVMARFLEFLPGASEETRERMTEYCRKLGAEVCLRALDAARDAAPVARNRMAYLFGILRNREADGIRSGAEWDAHERERRQHSRDAPARGAQKSAGELYEELQREMFSYDA